MAINFTSLFNEQRTIFDAVIGIHTARGTTIPNLVNPVLTANPDATLQDTLDQFEDATELVSAMQSLAEERIQYWVNLDAPHASASIDDALTELIRQMDGAQSVQENTVSATVTTEPAGTAPPALIVTGKQD